MTNKENELMLSRLETIETYVDIDRLKKERGIMDDSSMHIESCIKDIKTILSRPQPSADVEQLMRETCVYSDKVTMPIPTYEALKQTLTRPNSDDFKQLTFGRGMLDINNITFEGRDGLLFKKRINYSPVGTEDKTKLGETEFHKDDIVFWFDAKEGAENLINEIALCANITQPKAVDVDGLHSKIDLDFEDKTGNDITIKESQTIGVVLNLLNDQGYINSNECVQELEDRRVRDALHDEANIMYAECQKKQECIDAMLVKLKVATEALKFYADDKNHLIDVNYSQIDVDEGKTAKQALQQIGGGRDE